MANNIIIEFCAEDRARLDKIIHLLEKLGECDRCASVLAETANGVKNTAEAIGAAKAPAQERKTEPTPTPEQVKPEKPAEAKNEPDSEPSDGAPWDVNPWGDTPAAPSADPAVTHEQIRQKVMQLSAGSDATKKAAARKIVNAYAQKISDLPEDKLVEVWKKLTELEG